MNEWHYEVKARGEVGFCARQFLNGVLLKSWPCETEREAQEMCGVWEAMHR